MFRNLIIIAGIMILFGSSASFSKDGLDTIMTKERQAKVFQMMKLIGMDKIGENMYENFISAYRSALPSVTAEYWDSLRKFVSVDALNDKLSNVYIRYFTDKDIQAMIDFFSSSPGKKFVDVMQNLTNDNYEIAELWFKEETDRIKDKLIQDGHLNIQK